MNDENVLKINIEKEIPFFGVGDSLESRLRKVSLRGFPDVKIYEKAAFEVTKLNSKDIVKKLHTPQPTVYRTHLDKIQDLHRLFKEEGIDILNLNKAYDFSAVSKNGETTEWTMLPPVIERFFIPRDTNNRLCYESLLGIDLIRFLDNQNLWLNQDLTKLNHTSNTGIYNLINDGSHRIHYGYENGGIKVLIVEEMTSGYPYYAAPQPYSSVNVAQVRDQDGINTKIHVLQDPAHKSLYRLFPSGGIKSGDVRPEKIK